MSAIRPLYISTSANHAALLGPARIQLRETTTFDALAWQKIAEFGRHVDPSGLHAERNFKDVLAPIGEIPLSAVRTIQHGFRTRGSQLSIELETLKKIGRLRAPITLILFKEDGALFVRDGHHRMEGLRKQGRKWLINTETSKDFIIEIFSYSDFDNIVFRVNPDGKLNLSKSWITPFDPRINQRKSDTNAFKSLISHFWSFMPADELRTFIRAHPELYLDNTDQTSPIESARDYHEYFARMLQSNNPKIAQSITGIPNRGVIVDIGAGSGDQSAYYALRYPDLQVIGVDNSALTIAHAASLHKLGNLIFMLADATQTIAPPNSLDGVVDSSVVHEIYSYTGFSKRNVIKYYDSVFRALKVGGQYSSRDFVIAEWPGQVRFSVENQTGGGEGSFGQLSRADLFREFASSRRTKDFPAGIAYREIPTNDPKFTTFETSGVAAQDFILRMEYRNNWIAEMREQYMYTSLREKIAQLEAAGLRVDSALETHSAWIYINWWKNRLNITDTDDIAIDYPPTSSSIISTKPAHDQPRSMHALESRTIEKNDEFHIKHFQNSTDPTVVFDLIHSESVTHSILPFSVQDDGLVYMYVRRGVQVPLLHIYSQRTSIYNLHYGGFSTLGEEIQGDYKPNDIARLLGDVEISDSNDLPLYLPSPGMSDEIVHPHTLEVNHFSSKSMEGWQRLDIKQIIAGAHVGSLPDPRLETAAYALAKRFGVTLDNWMDGALPFSVQDFPENLLGKSERLFLQLGGSTQDDDVFQETDKNANFATILSTDIEYEYSGKPSEVGTKNSVSPINKSPDTTLVVPYVVTKDGVMVGFERRALPAFQSRGLSAYQSVIPAWRIKKGVNKRSSASQYLEERMKADFELNTSHITPLGEGYFPSPHHILERVTPFAVEVDLKTLPRDLTFIPLSEAMQYVEDIPDLHTKVGLYRLAHAMKDV